MAPRGTRVRAFFPLPVYANERRGGGGHSQAATGRADLTCAPLRRHQGLAGVAASLDYMSNLFRRVALM